MKNTLDLTAELVNLRGKANAILTTAESEKRELSEL